MTGGCSVRVSKGSERAAEDGDVGDVAVALLRPGGLVGAFFRITFYMLLFLYLAADRVTVKLLTACQRSQGNAEPKRTQLVS